MKVDFNEGLMKVLEDKYTEIASDQTIEVTAAALKANGMEAEVVESAKSAKARVLELIPEGAEVFTMTSMTLEAIGIPSEINESGRYKSVRNQLNNLDRATAGRKMQQLGSSPDWTVGSVHALTADGHALIASRTGSQLAAYASGASHVIWVVGAQKIVNTDQDGLKRIYEHSLPLEIKRAEEAYGTSSQVNKILTVHREIVPGRVRIIIVKEALGF